MKFEKLNENKIRIILNIADLEEKDIDFHSFMSNSIESQEIFLNMLEEAEKRVGFITKDYKLMIEALATVTGNFILTVTRMNPEISINDKSKKKLSIKRKNNDIKYNDIIYKFNCFDDYIEFCKILHKTLNIQEITIKQNLYLYNSKYYLVFYNISKDYKILKKFASFSTEYAYFINNSDLFVRKLTECGTIIMKQNAIETCLTYF